jgi:hypothetical protein
MGISGVGGWARRALAAAATAGIAVSTVVAGGAPAPAGAQAQSLVVTPSTDLTDGQEVTVTVTVDGPVTHVAQCHAKAAANPSFDNIRSLCGAVTSVQGDTRPVDIAHTVHSTFTSSTGQVVDCGLQPGDCFVVALAFGGSSYPPQLTGFASAPITIEPPVFAAILPDLPLRDGEVVDVLGRGVPGESVTVAQCASPVAAAAADSRCGPPVDLVVGADGRMTGRLTVTLDVDTGGDPLDCGAEACALAAFDAQGALVREVPITMQAPLGITVTPAAGLVDGTRVGVEVTGFRKVEMDLRQCTAGTTPDGLGGVCVPLARIPAGWGPVWREVQVKASVTPDHPCGNAPGDCVLLVGTNGWSPWATTPLSFARAAAVPSTGLVDGQPTTVSATGLVPNSSYEVVRCDGSSINNCERSWTAPRLVTDAEGRGEMELAAAQRFTSRTATEQYCRDECSIRLSPTAGQAPAVIVPYAMAEGSLAASPSSGLADGDMVTLTGSDLMASYEGPPFWIFPSTGGWGIAQCGAGILDDQTILGVFTHCALASPATVHVPGSTASVEVPVASSITSILGQQVDCASAPESCALVVARIEQDGSVSVHGAPVTIDR